MKTFLLIAFLILGFTASAQPPMLRGSMTTNTPLVQLYSMPRFNVVNYGVTPGLTQAQATNAQVGIQAAIDAAGLAGGGVVWFPKGCYGLGTNYVHPTYLTETFPSALIMPSNNVYLAGESPGSVMLTQLVFHASGNNVIGSGSDSPASGPTNVGLINLRLCGQVAVGRDLTQFQRTYNTLFESVSFESVGQDAIDIQSGGAFFVQNCTFSNVIANAISAQNTEGFVDGFTVNGVVGGDFEFFTGKYTVQNGAFYNTTNQINVTSADMVVIDNVYFNNPNVNTTNIHVTSAASIRNCYFSGGGSSGFAILANTNSILYVSDCTFLDRGIVALRPALLSVKDTRFSTATSGVRLQGGSNVKIHDNYFLLAEAMRLTDGVPSHNVSFMDNYCAASCNFYTDTGGTNPIIVGNYFQDSEIRFQGGEANGYIANNVMKGAAAQFEHSGGGHFVSGNILRDVNFLNTTTSTFANNQITLLSGNATGIAGSGYFGISGTDMYGNGAGITNISGGGGSGSNFFFTNIVVSGVVELTDASTIATDSRLGSTFRVTLGGNRTLGNPSNPRDGQRYTWEVIQDATGVRTLTMDTKFAFGTDITGITLTTNATKRDFITGIYNATADKVYIVGFVRGF